MCRVTVGTVFIIRLLWRLCELSLNAVKLTVLDARDVKMYIYAHVYVAAPIQADHLFLSSTKQ